MTTKFTPQDQDHRNRIALNLDETLFVEAGAGTGKTEALVSRIVALITGGFAQIGGIAAITFTDLAASELRERIRSRLESLAESELQSAISVSLAREAIRNFDSASIQTLHSFAGQLLRDRPLDIGLPPSFDVVEDIEADLNFHIRWDKWLDKVLESGEIGDILSKALSLGLKMDQLRDIGSSFHTQYDLLGSPFPLLTTIPYVIAQDMITAREEIESLLPLAHNHDDPLANHARDLISFTFLLEKIGAETSTALAALSRHGNLRCRHGRQGDWDTDPTTGINGCAALKNLFTDLEALRTSELDNYRAYLLCQILESVRQLSIDYFEERVIDGKIEFQDMLVLGRNLLRDCREAREYFQAKYTHILIDEFQDTDPIQAEIAILLSSMDIKTYDVSDRLIPGKLFAVGDPKQSIYKFRGADISVSEQLKSWIPGGQVDLTQNFRSEAQIISWVNQLFEHWMNSDDDSEGKIEYKAISAMWNSDLDKNSSRVKYIGEMLEESADATRLIEFKNLANTIKTIKNEKWLIRNGEQEFKEAQYQDICILLPTRTGADVLESTLSAAEIPYRIESRSMILGTQDVRDLLNCLRAIDSPSDQIALVSALRSSIFACSDLELYSFVKSGNELDYLSTINGEGPIQSALELIRKFHELRIWISPDDLIERFTRETKMVESCFASSRPREKWRRIRFVIDRATEFARVSNTSLRSYLDWIERQAEEGARVIESPIPEPDEDAVRIMTIHASKGLEFPIVILTGLGSQPRSNVGPIIYDRKSQTAEVDLQGIGEGRFKTPDYDNAENQEKLENLAERIRLMYVATTRAKDHLIISLYRPKPRGADSSYASTFEQLIGKDSDLWEELVVTDQPNSIEEADAADSKEKDPFLDDLMIRESWQHQRNEQITVNSRSMSVGATTLAHLVKEEADHGDNPYKKGRGGTSLGRAVHSVLQDLDLTTGEGLQELSRVQATAEGIPTRWPEIVELTQTALNSKIVQEAISASKYYKEMYVGASSGQMVIEGFVDLLFETTDGLVIVDYKTDNLETPQDIANSMTQYRIQGGAYAFSLSKATGRPVSRVVFLFLGTGHEVAIEDLPGAIHDVEELVAAQ